MKQTMRTTPSITYSTTYSKYRLLNNGTVAAKTPTSIGIGFSGTNIIGVDVGASGVVAGEMWFFSANASDSYLLFSAEL